MFAKEGGGAVMGLAIEFICCCNGSMGCTWLARRFFAADMEAALLMYWVVYKCT
jgi:hypothetical protein